MNNYSLVGLKLVAGMMSLLALVLLVIFGFAFFQNRTAKSSEPVSYNMFYPQKINDHTIYYYNDNHFLKLDTNTQEITSLTPNVSYPIPGASEITWTSHGVYFYLGDEPSSNPLAEVYNSELLDADTVVYDYYWYLSFDASTPQLAFYTDKSPYKSIIASNDRVIYSLDGAIWQFDKDGQSTQLEQVTSDFDSFLYPLSVTNNQIIFVLHGTREANVFAFDRSSKETKRIQDVVITSENGIDFTVHDKSLYTNLVYENGSQQLIYTDIDTGKRVELLTPFAGSVYRDGDQVYALYVGRDEIATYQLNKDKSSLKYRFDSKGQLPTSVHCFDKSCYLANVRGVAQVITHDKSILEATKPASTVAIEDVVDVPGVILDRDVLSRYDSSYSVIVGAGDITRPYSQLQEAIRKQGINPYDFSFDITQGQFAQP